MVMINCPIDDCAFATDDVDAVVAAALLNVHSNVNHSAAPTTRPVGPAVTTRTLAQVMTAVRTLAVVSVARGIIRAELMRMVYCLFVGLCVS